MLLNLGRLNKAATEPQFIATVEYINLIKEAIKAFKEDYPQYIIDNNIKLFETSDSN